MDTTGLILLAAGQSKRLGKPKQLLDYKSKTLLQRSLDVADHAKAAASVIVYGAYEADIKKHTEHHSFIPVTNPEWEEGIASSLSTGLTTLLQHDPDVTHVLIMAADQPFITTSLLNDLMLKAQTTDCGIIASCYNNVAGTPVVFDQKYFALLLLLMGDEGIKKIIKSHMHDVHCVDFPLGYIDINTIDDYNMLASTQSGHS